MIGFVSDMFAWVKAGFACGSGSHGKIANADIHIAERQGLNQKELADKSGVSAQLINRYWNYPMQRVELDALVKIAKALNCKLADLTAVEDEDDGKQAA